MKKNKLTKTRQGVNRLRGKPTQNSPMAFFIFPNPIMATLTFGTVRGMVVAALVLSMIFLLNPLFTF